MQERDEKRSIFGDSLLLWTGWRIQRSAAEEIATVDAVVAAADPAVGVCRDSLAGLLTSRSCFK